LSYRQFDLSAGAVIAAAFAAAMIVLAMIDLEHYILPDVITKPGIVVGLVLQPWIPWSTLAEALIGVALGAGLLAGLSWGWYWLRGVHGMGFGDVKMLAMVGAFLGWQGVVGTLLLGSIGGTAVGLGLMVAGRGGLQSKLPFGFFLAVGAILSLFYSAELFETYLRISGLDALVGQQGVAPAP
ncbi:MAG: A24 family peptidase, partial [Acidobacteriota bacterium]